MIKDKMSHNFFYYDSNSQRQGPFNYAQLRALVTSRQIVPQTPMETDGGHRGTAGQIKGLFDSLTGESSVIPPPVPKPEMLSDGSSQENRTITAQGEKTFAEHSYSFFLAYRTYRRKQIPFYLCGIGLLSIVAVFFGAGIAGLLTFIVLGTLFVGIDCVFFLVKIKQRQHYCEQGDDYVAKKEYEKAIECYEKAVEYGNVDAQRKINETKAKQGQHYYEQGENYAAKKEYKNMFTCYEKAVKYGNADAQRKIATNCTNCELWGDDCFNREQYREAIEWYDKVIQYGNESQKAIAHYYRGKCYFILEDWRSASIAFIKATNGDSERHLSQSMRGDALYYRGFADFKHCEGKSVSESLNDLFRIKHYLREAINIGCSASVQPAATLLLQQIERMIPFSD